MIYELISSTIVLGSCGLILSVLIVIFDRFFADSDSRNEFVESINALLPQTQCAQCGYPGCAPYAEAIAEGESLGLCIPGGEATQRNLAALLNRTLDSTILPTPKDVVARIREKECVGCARCIDVCPVDAIVGAERFMHAILEKHCTGCELCLPICPVDCIELVART